MMNKGSFNSNQAYIPGDNPNNIQQQQQQQSTLLPFPFQQQQQQQQPQPPQPIHHQYPPPINPINVPSTNHPPNLNTQYTPPNLPQPSSSLHLSQITSSPNQVMSQGTSLTNIPPNSNNITNAPNLKSPNFNSHSVQNSSTDNNNPNYTPSSQGNPVGSTNATANNTNNGNNNSNGSNNNTNNNSNPTTYSSSCSNPQMPGTSTMALSSHICICPNTARVPRPRNAFILYRQHHHAKVVAAYPGKTNPEISKIIGERWRSLAQEEKDFWIHLGDEEKKSHLERFPDYRYQPRRSSRKSGSGPTDSLPGICPICKGITSAAAAAAAAAASTTSNHNKISNASNNTNINNTTNNSVMVNTDASHKNGNPSSSTNGNINNPNSDNNCSNNSSNSNLSHQQPYYSYQQQQQPQQQQPSQQQQLLPPLNNVSVPGQNSPQQAPSHTLPFPFSRDNSVTNGYHKHSVPSSGLEPEYPIDHSFRHQSAPEISKSPYPPPYFNNYQSSSSLSGPSSNFQHQQPPQQQRQMQQVLNYRHSASSITQMSPSGSSFPPPLPRIEKLGSDPSSYTLRNRNSSSSSSISAYTETSSTRTSTSTSTSSPSSEFPLRPFSFFKKQSISIDPKPSISDTQCNKDLQSQNSQNSQNGHNEPHLPNNNNNNNNNTNNHAPATTTKLRSVFSQSIISSLSEEETFFKRRRTSSYHDPLINTPPSNKGTVISRAERYKSAFSLAASHNANHLPSSSLANSQLPGDNLVSINEADSRGSSVSDSSSFAAAPTGSSVSGSVTTAVGAGSPLPISTGSIGSFSLYNHHPHRSSSNLSTGNPNINNPNSVTNSIATSNTNGGGGSSHHRMSLREKADAISTICEPLLSYSHVTGAPTSRLKNLAENNALILSIEGPDSELNQKFAAVLEEKLKLIDDNASNEYNASSISIAKLSLTKDVFKDEIKPEWLTDETASRIWKVACLHQSLSSLNENFDLETTFSGKLMNDDKNKATEKKTTTVKDSEDISKLDQNKENSDSQGNNTIKPVSINDSRRVIIFDDGYLIKSADILVGNESEISQSGTSLYASNNNNITQSKLQSRNSIDEDKTNLKEDLEMKDVEENCDDSQFKSTTVESVEATSAVASLQTTSSSTTTTTATVSVSEAVTVETSNNISASTSSSNLPLAEAGKLELDKENNANENNDIANTAATDSSSSSQQNTDIFPKNTTNDSKSSTNRTTNSALPKIRIDTNVGSSSSNNHHSNLALLLNSSNSPVATSLPKHSGTLSNNPMEATQPAEDNSEHKTSQKDEGNSEANADILTLQKLHQQQQEEELQRQQQREYNLWYREQWMSSLYMLKQLPRPHITIYIEPCPMESLVPTVKTEDEADNTSRKDRINNLSGPTISIMTLRGGSQMVTIDGFPDFKNSENNNNSENIKEHIDPETFWKQLLTDICKPKDYDNSEQSAQADQTLFNAVKQQTSNVIEDTTRFIRHILS